MPKNKTTALIAASVLAANSAYMPIDQLMQMPELEGSKLAQQYEEEQFASVSLDMSDSIIDEFDDPIWDNEEMYAFAKFA